MRLPLFVTPTRFFYLSVSFSISLKKYKKKNKPLEAKIKNILPLFYFLFNFFFLIDQQFFA